MPAASDPAEIVMPATADRRPLIGIVGSGIAGLRAADAILKCEVDARIVVFGDEAHRTYNRPGLTKKRYPLSGALEKTIAEDVRVKGADNDAVTWRLGIRVETADLGDRILRLSTGETFEYDRLVIASGIRPRTSARGDGECELHTHRTLRGLGDARYIHHRLQAGEKVTIVGAGFVACELASLAKEYGCEVLVLEALRRGPFESVLGERVAMTLGRWLAQQGVTFLTGDSARKFLCEAKPSNPEPASDRSLFIEAIGSVPNVEWLHGNGLDLSDGVRVDEYMRVSPWENVFAAGDIARYPDPWAAGNLTRMEFWKNAIDTGDLAGRSVAASLGHGSVTSRIGYFPSMTTEVLGLRIQIAGDPKTSDSMEIVCGDLDRPDQGVLVAYLREGAMIGAAYLDKGARFNSAYIKLLRSLRER
ncbi:NAD(P)/FAD-dependent oxidoreductase [Streptomyces sennicomposti]|uniref:NAD(P)/FAD-dependent oxidoreductase n=1 Tax=Streptomyces sennicomposti TaxID=2873384 RepID=UPI001CA6A7DB|nr:NAD(P)/FAD-dependent oxidoreductase [Streptomyces sennicomposti]MBY8867709.1 NAD(P)/FAD-dependent oxidoreductase [Streptomyces sennicomposti]